MSAKNDAAQLRARLSTARASVDFLVDGLAAGERLVADLEQLLEAAEAKAKAESDAAKAKADKAAAKTKKESK